MRPPETFIGQPIRSLQTMLRIIAQRDSDYGNIIPDGIYGPQTMGAISTFQRKHGLPITGITDQATWDAVVAEFEPALTDQVPATLLRFVQLCGLLLSCGGLSLVIGV